MFCGQLIFVQKLPEVSKFFLKTNSTSRLTRTFIQGRLCRSNELFGSPDDHNYNFRFKQTLLEPISLLSSEPSAPEKFYLFLGTKKYYSR